MSSSTTCKFLYFICILFICFSVLSLIIPRAPTTTSTVVVLRCHKCFYLLILSYIFYFKYSVVIICWHSFFRDHNHYMRYFALYFYQFREHGTRKKSLFWLLLLILVDTIFLNSIFHNIGTFSKEHSFVFFNVFLHVLLITGL